MTEAIDEAISKLKAQIIQDSYDNGGYAGSVATQAMAIELINERMENAMPLIESEYKPIVQALWNGVISDVKYAGTQVRERYL